MTTLSARDARYIEAHAAEYDPELDDMDSLSAAWRHHRDIVLGKCTARPKRERSLADVSMAVDRLIVEMGLTAERLAAATGLHRCTIEKMRSGTLGGRPSVRKVVEFAVANGYSDTVRRVMAIMDGANQ